MLQLQNSNEIASSNKYYLYYQYSHSTIDKPHTLSAVVETIIRMTSPRSVRSLPVRSLRWQEKGIPRLRHRLCLRLRLVA